jgi:anti-sigma factor RsiW
MARGADRGADVNHIDSEQLSARLDGALRGGALEQVESHLAACAHCRAELAVLAAQDAALEPMLAHDPGEAYFATFAARVDDRIRAAGLSGAQARLGGDGVFGWLRSPRKLAWAGAIAAVVVGAAIVLLTPQTPTELESTAIRERLEQSAPATRSLESAPAPQAEAPAAPSPAPRVTRQDADAQRVGTAQRSGAVAGDRMQAQQQARGKAVVTPQRAREVRRTPSGEDVPVRDERLDRFTPSPTEPQPQPVQEGVGVRVRKPGAAQPLQAESLAGTAPSASFGLTADETRFCGQVVDIDGRPVAGAQVALTERGRSAATDASGNFCLSAPAGNYELSVMAVGYSEVRQQVRVTGESAGMRLTLRPVTVLDEQRVRTLARERGGLPETTLGFVHSEAFAGVPEDVQSIVRTAKRLTTAAARRKSASRFEAAAVQWELVVRGLDQARSRMNVEDRAVAPAEARYQLAAARFQAWQAGRNPTRAARAAAALKAFLAGAESGAQRDQAAKWLEAVRR